MKQKTKILLFAINFTNIRIAYINIYLIDKINFICKINNEMAQKPAELN